MDAKTRQKKNDLVVVARSLLRQRRVSLTSRGWELTRWKIEERLVSVSACLVLAADAAYGAGPAVLIDVKCI